VYQEVKGTLWGSYAHEKRCGGQGEETERDGKEKQKVIFFDQPEMESGRNMRTGLGDEKGQFVVGNKRNARSRVRRRCILKGGGGIRPEVMN